MTNQASATDYGARLQALPPHPRAPGPAVRQPERRRATDGGHRAGADGQTAVLLLDEPSLGLAPIFVDAIFEVVREINSRGRTILLIEQNALLALRTAGRAPMFLRPATSCFPAPLRGLPGHVGGSAARLPGDVISFTGKRRASSTR